MASLSRLGVLTSPPRQLTSKEPRSSARMKMTLGFGEAKVACAHTTHTHVNKRKGKQMRFVLNLIPVARCFAAAFSAGQGGSWVRARFVWGTSWRVVLLRT